MSTKRSATGSALLAVLWLSAALTAIAFSVALSVRGEIRRAENTMDGVRAHFLAMGGLERAFTYIYWGPNRKLPNGAARYWEQGRPLLMFPSELGVAAVEVIPESSRLNVNTIPQDELTRLLLALGLDPMRAQLTASAIVDWRIPAPQMFSPFDRFYSESQPSFRAPHASLEQIEELLSVQGITPDLFYGRFERLANGQLAHLAGLRDCLSVYSGSTPLDINTVALPVMIALGVPPAAAETVVALRSRAPLVQAQLPMLNELIGPAMNRFRLGGDRIFTLRSTARLRLPDGSLSSLRRSASMTVEFFARFSPEGYRILNSREADPAQPLFDVWPQ